jgi:hypothetical protein
MITYGTAILYSNLDFINCDIDITKNLSEIIKQINNDVDFNEISVITIISSDDYSKYLVTLSTLNSYINDYKTSDKKNIVVSYSGSTFTNGATSPNTNDNVSNTNTNNNDNNIITLIIF